MKKTLLVFMLFSQISLNIHGQTTNTFPSSGDAGIGTTSPTGKLHIAGAFSGGILQDGNDRPSIGLSGHYPQAVLMAGGNGNGSHGPTFMLGSYDSGTSGANKHWSIGTSGQNSTFLDIGYSGANDINPHAGIRNYNGSTIMTLLNSGNVGIGTLSPNSKLDVRGTISVPEIAFRNDDGGDDSDPYRLRKVRTAFNENWLELQLNDDGNESFRIYGNSCQGYSCGPYSNNLYHSFDASGNAYHQGNLAIGTTNPQGYKLAVAGSMITESIKVKLAGNWPDYVFSKNHSLLSLGDLEKYIQTNKHLPEIPSTEEVKKDGIELGEMNAKLLKKIEELTLYLIEQNKELKRQQEQLNTQQNEILSLKNTIKNP